MLHDKTHPDLKAVMIQSAQKRCRHSLVVIVFFNMSRQIGHMSSLCRDLGDTAISSPSVIASCASRIQIKMKVSTHKVTALCGVVLKSHHQYMCGSSLPGRTGYVLQIYVAINISACQWLVSELMVWIITCGVLCSSYKLSSQVLLRGWTPLVWTVWVITATLKHTKPISHSLINPGCNDELQINRRHWAEKNYIQNTRDTTLHCWLHLESVST